MPSQAPQVGEIPSLLRAHPFLRALPEVALDRLLSNGARREAEIGSVLLRQGEASDSAMLLLVGAVEVVAETVSGEIQHRFALLRPQGSASTDTLAQK